MTLTADTMIQTEATFVCTRCGAAKPASAYYSYNGRRMNHCKACEIARSAASHRDAGVQIHATRTFGVEVECYSPVDTYTVADKLNAAGINTHVEGYNHTTRAHWKIVSDGSLNERPAGCAYPMELVSPPLAGKAGLKAVKTALKVLETLGCKVNKTCGIHVHHDARDLDLASWKRLLTTYATFEAQIDTYQPASRRANNAYYCRSLTSRFYGSPTETVDRINGARRRETLQTLWGTRYVKVNTQSYVKHGTLEFRQHAGSVNGEKVNNWIILTQLMVLAAKSNKPRTNDLLTSIGAKAKVARYFEARATTLAA
jgi:hypothetical protein